MEYLSVIATEKHNRLPIHEIVKHGLWKDLIVEGFNETRDTSEALILVCLVHLVNLELGINRLYNRHFVCLFLPIVRL